MGFKEIVQNLTGKNKERKELLRKLDERYRMEKIIEDRQKSANERELERYMNEDREQMIKEQLEVARRNRDNDIRFNHNPLDTPNIVSKTKWNVLKEKNQFTNNGCMFTNQQTVLKNNKNLLKNNRRLFQ